MLYIFFNFLKILNVALGSMAQLVGASSCRLKGCMLKPWSECILEGNQLMFLILSLKGTTKMSSGEDKESWIKKLKFLSLFFKDPHLRICLLISERREKKEKHWSVTSCMCLDRWLNHILGMCPDKELNPQHFGIWKDTQTKCPTWPGLRGIFVTQE